MMEDWTKRLNGMNAQEYQAKSSERLRGICLKKIDTTMIGALDIIEKEIQDVCRNSVPSVCITLKEAYSRMRSKILDNGNNQKRAINEEFKHYTIHWNMYTTTLAVKPRVQYDTFTITEGQADE